MVRAIDLMPLLLSACDREPDPDDADALEVATLGRAGIDREALLDALAEHGRTVVMLRPDEGPPVVVLGNDLDFGFDAVRDFAPVLTELLALQVHGTLRVTEAAEYGARSFDTLAEALADIGPEPRWPGDPTRTRPMNREERRAAEKQRRRDRRVRR